MGGGGGCPPKLAIYTVPAALLPHTHTLYRCSSMSQLRSSDSLDGLANYSNHFNAMATVQAFKTHRADLLKIATSSLNVISHLLSNEIIPEPTKARIIFSNLPQSEKSEALLEAIEARIILNPDVFHTVVKLLDNDKTHNLALKLRSSFRKFCLENIIFVTIKF